MLAGATASLVGAAGSASAAELMAELIWLMCAEELPCSYFMKISRLLHMYIDIDIDIVPHFKIKT